MNHTDDQFNWPSSAEFCQTLMESMPIGVLLTDSDGNLLFANEQAAQIIGYEPEEIKDTLPWLANPEQEADQERQIITKSGERLWISHSWSPIIGDDGVHLTLSLIRDITEQKQTADLQQDFIKNISHEVRTPLTAVKGYAEMLLEGIAGDVSEDQAALLRKVLTSSDHLLDLVNGILHTARLKNGHIALNPRVCNPMHIVEKSISAVAIQARQKGLTINVQSDSTDRPGIYDEEKLVIILTNLLTNAIKFTETGSIEVMITCSESGIEIVVADTGIGITSTNLSSIFDEFQQLDHPRKHKTSGFGVGLAIVATMVEAIGAGLVVSSEQGIGTAFTLFAPELEA